MEHPCSTPSNKREQVITTRNTMGESQMNHAKQKKTGSKNYTLYDSLCMVFWKRQNYRGKIDQWLPGPEGRERRTAKKHEGILEGNLTVRLLHCDGDNTTVCLSKLIEPYTKRSGLLKYFYINVNYTPVNPI